MPLAVTLAGAAAVRSLLRLNVSNRSSSAYLTLIATDGALSELRGLRLYTTAAPSEIAHETYREEATVECAYTTTNAQSPSVGEKFKFIPNTVNQTMKLPVKLAWKTPQTRMRQA